MPPRRLAPFLGTASMRFGGTMTNQRTIALTEAAGKVVS
jgi:hypothetical protein